MSAKNRDEHNRWRNRTVAFRMSPEEAQQLDKLTELSGLTKQDYITSRLLCRDVVVQGNPRVYKALRDQMNHILGQLQRISSGETVSPELMELMQFVAEIMDGMKEECR